jgi:hypothetical protein
MNAVIRVGAGALLCAIGFALSAPPAGAQLAPATPGSDYRQFTNKEGRTLDARVLSVSPDRKTAKLLLRDGKSVDFEIVRLSLDDQQYLKELVVNTSGTGSTPPAATPTTPPPPPTAVVNRRIQVTFERIAAKPTEDRLAGTTRLVTEHVAYRIGVTNLDQATLEGAEIAYAMLVRDEAAIYPDASAPGSWKYSFPESHIQRFYSIRPPGNIVPDRELKIETGPARVDEIAGEGGSPQARDEVVGVMMRIKDASGSVLGIWHSGEAGIAKMTWDEVLPPEYIARATDPDRRVTGRGIPVEKGKSYGGDKLEIDGRPFTVFATILPDGSAPDGVIASHGAERRGWALLSRAGEIVFMVRTDETTVSKVSAKRPENATQPYLVIARLKADTVTLTIAEQPPVEAPSRGFLAENPTDPLSVGFETGSPVDDSYSGTYEFAGSIEEFSVRFPLDKSGPGF